MESVKKIPKHVAIIMDGNGRWAKKRGLPRYAGHHQGVKASKRVVSIAGELGIKYITLFGFSSENWGRPEQEVNELMRLLRMYLRAETAELQKNNVRLRVIGFREDFADDIVELIENAEELTKNNDGLNLTLALNYGGQNEIIKAAADMAGEMIKKGIEPTFKNAEEHFPRFLSTAGIPDPDIIIRTSGEKRISNFLLWQMAYSELFFTDTLWPDFGKKDLQEAIEDFSKRERRFGAISSN